MSLSITCKAALEEVERTRSNVTRFWNLIYAVSVALVLFTIGLVVALVWGSDPAKAVSGGATVASSGGLAFVVRQKNAANADHEGAKKALRRDCRQARPVATRGMAVDSDPAGLPDEVIDILAG